jgi:hypoxanthine-DNA glycosylase
MTSPRLALTDAPTLEGLPPRFTTRARCLVLGSFPGTQSLQATRYYAHPRNLFWRLLQDVLCIDAAAPYGQRLQALDDAGVALWDVLQACQRRGSLDSQIRSATPNDLSALHAQLPQLRDILLNGRAAAQLFQRHAPDSLRDSGLRVWSLPSTSPANASIPYATKLQRWREALASIREH